MSQPTTPHGTAQELASQLRTEVKDKIILITGVSPNSIGAASAAATATASPSHLILAGRNPSKTQLTADAIAASHPHLYVRTLKLDLASQSSVRDAAKDLLSWDLPRIDVLVNNAGVMGTDYALTADGVESQFATNHVGHFLFTNLIMERLLKSEAPRVVNVASDGHRMGPVRFNDYNFDVRYALSPHSPALFSPNVRQGLHRKPD
ncbi:SDR family NAD(P)-dependent oxidoreductase [Candidatus Bathyarchaeota archaeon]|nr:SDR family NAD(P)-dependent oxidoreductase [Candidatus Bathyarchaeota archaeon]